MTPGFAGSNPAAAAIPNITKERESMFVVTRTYTFDPESRAALFSDKESALCYMRWLWEDYYNEEIAEGGDLNELECYFEDDYARITWHDGDRAEFHMIPIGCADIDTVKMSFEKGKIKS